MPSVSKKQKQFMAMCATPEGRAWARKNGVKCPPLSVAQEYVAADKKETKPLPKKAATRDWPLYPDRLTDEAAMWDPRVWAADLGPAAGGGLLSRFLINSPTITPGVAQLSTEQLTGMGRLLDELKTNNVNFREIPQSWILSSHYNPGSRVVSAPLNPGVLAHELGHATGRSIPGYRLGTPGLALGAMGAAMLRDRDQAEMAAVGGTALAVPKLLEELRATGRGVRYLRKHRLPGKLGAGAGLISYFGAAASPLAVLKVRDHFGLWDPKETGLMNRAKYMIVRALNRLRPQR